MRRCRVERGKVFITISINSFSRLVNALHKPEWHGDPMAIEPGIIAKLDSFRFSLRYLTISRYPLYTTRVVDVSSGPVFIPSDETVFERIPSGSNGCTVIIHTRVAAGIHVKAGCSVTTTGISMA